MEENIKKALKLLDEMEFKGINNAMRLITIYNLLTEKEEDEHGGVNS